MMKTNVYVDGFNLYYGAVKGTPFRWLDMAAMCRMLLPGDQINRIKYFTALVDARPATRISRCVRSFTGGHCGPSQIWRSSGAAS